MALCQRAGPHPQVQPEAVEGRRGTVCSAAPVRSAVPVRCFAPARSRATPLRPALASDVEALRPGGEDQAG